MKKIASVLTTGVKAGLLLKRTATTLTHPLQSVRNAVRNGLICGLVALVKKTIQAAQPYQSSSDHRVVRQLNAIADPNANIEGLQKTFKLRLTMDFFLEHAVVDEPTNVGPWNTTALSTRVAQWKNRRREELFEYLTENHFENMFDIVDGLNEAINAPTELIGCTFANVTLDVESHDPQIQHFVVWLTIVTSLKSQPL
jgi:hypothetical protein